MTRERDAGPPAAAGATAAPAEDAGHRAIDGLAADIARQRKYVAARVPSYDRVLALVADQLDGDIGRRLSKAWARHRFDIFYERPLLLLASLRHDALITGPAHPLWAALAADRPDPDAVTPAAVAAALDRAPARARVWHDLTRRRVQTNEVSRAVAWLWPAQLVARTAGGSPAPLALVDLGCSAGLNLVADRMALGWTDADGAPLAVADAPRVVERLGLDGAPLDPTRDDDAAWLRACVWAGEHDRLERLERAIAAFRAARDADPAPPQLETVRARDMPARLAERAAVRPGPVVWLLYQTVMREYLGPERDDYLDGMRRLLAQLPTGAALWVELEAPAEGATRRFPAALIAHVRTPAGPVIDRVIARCEYHPTELAIEPDGVAAVLAALAG